MKAPLLVVTGTGTGIGKTHATAAILGAWRRVLVENGVSCPRVSGLKPIETGVTAGSVTDAQTLAQASTFHVKHSPPYVFARPAAPHLAAADEGRTIELERISEYVEDVRAEADGVAVELPGGLFSPLGRSTSNLDLARLLDADAIVLVAPDRLGVLHDVAAATRAAIASGLSLSGVVLAAPEVADPSTGNNAAELGIITEVPLMAALPRASVAELAARDDLAALVRSFVTP